jgi:hypothetical protein
LGNLFVQNAFLQLFLNDGLFADPL